MLPTMANKHTNVAYVKLVYPAHTRQTSMLSEGACILGSVLMSSCKIVNGKSKHTA